METTHDKFILSIMCIIFPIIGVVLFLFLLGDKDKEKKKMGRRCLLMSIASLPIWMLIALTLKYIT
ncbi:hypothetical protein RYX56_00085 [Alkalihalophilus lindianensis]|uniref:Group-specific protein n=1 Tax=Alkalihalophilus lindianensis TaxID=1630542 RepID=A0ABU3X4E7_9BACI|nr:hypothetical protein [Alkalihalophilus lindianensis]MDV2682762.1 hypothetical protein [Alkalihalophilus lindianensis]